MKHFEPTSVSKHRPIISVRSGELHLMADEGEAALIEAEAPLFVRGGLVRPIVDELPAAHGRRTKVARLSRVDADTLRDHLSRVAEWTKWDGRSKKNVPTDPPKDVAAIILSRDGEWGLRKLAGVITTPTLRPDGTILSKAGYDAVTQLLLKDPPELPEIPDHPSRVDGLAALSLLDELLGGFPFVDDASRSVALSALITPVVRGALQVAPLHASTAPVAGSGKSFIIDLASAITIGQRAPVISAASTENETEKRLHAALLHGLPILSIDNVNGELGGDALCQAIERPVVSVRVLGYSKLVQIESRATCFATGNNIHLLGDMTRRVVLCSLDPNMERPELRQFKNNPFAEVLANRGKYIAAALTVVRAYIVAGFPNQLPALASFEDWSRLVRSAIVWLGRTDPVETMEAARADDPTTANLRAVVAGWYNAVVNQTKTAGAIINEASKWDGDSRSHPEFFHALFDVAEGKGGEINPKRLGHWLKRYKGRVVDGKKIVEDYDSKAKQKTWRIELVK